MAVGAGGTEADPSWLVVLPAPSRIRLTAESSASGERCRQLPRLHKARVGFTTRAVRFCEESMARGVRDVCGRVHDECGVRMKGHHVDTTSIGRARERGSCHML